VYNLWHGNIESLDGALQLLLIVDHIWSWAREIYRPSIYDSLTATYSSSRFHLGHRGSVCSLASSSDRTSEASSQILNHNDLLVEPPSSEKPMAAKIQELKNRPKVAFERIELEDATAHPFLRYGPTLRHSDLVLFSFVQREMTDLKHFLKYGNPSYSRRAREQVIELEAYSMPIRKRHISYIMTYWTLGSPLTLLDDPHEEAIDDVVSASFFFKTYIRANDRQIVRELSCIVWPRAVNAADAIFTTAAGNFQHDYVHGAHVLPALRELQEIRGKASFWCARHEFSVVLSPPSVKPGTPRVLWTLVNDHNTEALNIVSDILQDATLVNSEGWGAYQTSSGPILIIIGKNITPITESAQSEPESINLDSILMKVVRSSSQASAEFCLYACYEEALDGFVGLKEALTRYLGRCQRDRNTVKFLQDMIIRLQNRPKIK
jgi:hypothetical protein